MLIIGEKLNGTLKKTAAAIADRDATYVQEMARRQVAAGADYVDVNAGTPADREPEDLIWLVDTVQEATEAPLCLDSANPAALQAALPRVKQKPLINSISGEKHRLDGVLPLVPGNSAGVIALLLDDAGIPRDVDGRIAIAHRLLERTRAAGVPDDQVYVDPLAIAVSTRQDGALVAIETMRILRAEYPAIHYCVGLSNVSFGLPVRKAINRAFLSVAMASGLDAAILDPLDDSLYAQILATEMVLGRDRFCRKYLTGYRAGRVTA